MYTSYIQIKDVMTHRENEKFKKYDSLKRNYIFMPLVFDTFGNPGPCALHILNIIYSSLVDRSRDPRAGMFLSSVLL